MVRTRWRIPILVLLAVVLAAVVAFAGGGFYLSNVLRDGGLVLDHEEDEPDLVAIEIGLGLITLGITSETDEDGIWMRDGLFGLQGMSGFDQVGEILELDEDRVVREYFPLTGAPRAGDMASLEKYAFAGDPQTAHGIPFEEVTFTSPLGDFPAWFVDGSVDTWAIYVHGRTATRGEALRMLAIVADLGFPSLVISYRNDEGLPTDPSGYYRYGEAEWEELEAAARYALAHGARDLVLVGYSMGGGIVTNFLYESSLADSVRAVILDAPMLDFGATVDLGAREKGYPGVFSGLAKLFASWRFGVDWEALDYLGRVDELDVPILLFHGDEDPTVPVETSDELARVRSDLVWYVRVSGAVHVGAWNKDSAAYEEAVRDFLGELSR